MIPFDPMHPFTIPIISGLVSTFLWITSLIIAKHSHKKGFKEFFLITFCFYGVILSIPFDIYKIGAPKYFMHLETIIAGIPLVLSFLFLIFDSIFFLKEEYVLRRKRIKKGQLFVGIVWLSFSSGILLSGIAGFVKGS